MKKAGILVSILCISLVPAVVNPLLLPGQEQDFFDPFSTESDEQVITLDDGFSLDNSFETDFSDPFSDDFTDNPADELISDFDSLFLEDTGITIIEEDDSAGTDQTYESFLISEDIEWSGSFSGSMGFSWDWDTYSNGLSAEDYESSLTPSASTTLIFDARPEIDYRVFGKLFLETEVSAFDLSGLDLSSIDFADNGDGSIGISLPESSGDDGEEDEPEPSPLSLTLGIRELFADFQYGDNLFFRFGKSFVKWGVGYFFSPADVVNLDSIDAEDPTAERQGPLNLRLHYPSGVNNFYLYALTDQVSKPEDISYAAKSEYVIGNSEIGVGGYLSFNRANRLIATLSTSIQEVRIFGEGVISFGSDRVFVAVSKNQPEFDDDETNPYTALDTFSIDTLPIFSGTIGFSYNHTDQNIFITGQYFFNGEGYPYTETGFDKTLLDSAAYLLMNSGSNGLAVPEDQQPDDYTEPEAIDFGDIQNFGRHYGAMVFTAGNILDSDISASLLWLGNLTDGSGIVSPGISWDIMDRISLNAGLRFTYGGSGTEYADPAGLIAQNNEDNPQEPTLSITMDLSLGRGSF